MELAAYVPNSVYCGLRLEQEYLKKQHIKARNKITILHRPNGFTLFLHQLEPFPLLQLTIIMFANLLALLALGFSAIQPVFTAPMSTALLPRAFTGEGTAFECVFSNEPDSIARGSHLL